MEEIAMHDRTAGRDPAVRPRRSRLQRKPSLLSRSDGSNPLAWTVALIAVVALGGGGIVLLRRKLMSPWSQIIREVAFRKWNALLMFTGLAAVAATISMGKLIAGDEREARSHPRHGIQPPHHLGGDRSWAVLS